MLVTIKQFNISVESLKQRKYELLIFFETPAHIFECCY